MTVPPRTRAFTLIELLVVIAILAILAAILFPVFAQAKLAAKKTVALSETKQIALASILYATDKDDTIVPSALWLPTINGAPQRFMYAPAMCMLQPYVGSYALWSAPADPHTTFADGRIDANLWDGSLRGRCLPLSFNYVAPMRTVQAGGLDPNTGIGPNFFTGDVTKVRSTTAFDEPSNTIAFAEVWSDGLVGQADGSTLTNCDAWKLAGRHPGRDPTGDDVLPCALLSYALATPTPGYANGTANYVMTDGSAKSLTWGAVRRNDFYRFKVAKPSAVFVP